MRHPRNPWSTAWLTLGLAIGLPGALAGSGYLPVVGPAPLRFQLFAPPTEPEAALPPLVLTNSFHTPDSIQLPPELLADETVSPAATGAPSSDPALAALPSAVPSAPASETYTPRSFLQFFETRQDGRQNGGVVMPLGFTPALPAPAAQSSSATYTTR